GFSRRKSQSVDSGGEVATPKCASHIRCCVAATKSKCVVVHCLVIYRGRIRRVTDTCDGKGKTPRIFINIHGGLRELHAWSLNHRGCSTATPRKASIRHIAGGDGMTANSQTRARNRRNASTICCSLANHFGPIRKGHHAVGTPLPPGAGVTVAKKVTV